jgi:ABC-2 type transport system permease protein
MNSLAITWAFYRAAVRAEMQYRVNFVLLLVLGLVYQGSGFAFVWVVLQQFDSIAGWTFPQIAFLYSLRLLAHAAWVVPFHQVELMDKNIGEGKFDRFLVRPLNPLLQVITTRTQINVVGDVVVAVVLFVIAANLVDFSFSPLNVIYLLLAVLGGGLAEGAVIMAVSSMSFRFVRTWAAIHFADHVYLNFGSYPTTIFGGVMNWVLTWVVPVAFVAYIPSSVLLDKTDSLHVPGAVALLAPAVGLIWFYAAYRLWRWQIRGYQSAGG